MPDNMTENKAKEYLRGATLSRDDSLLKLRVTGSFPGYVTPGWDHFQDSVMWSGEQASSPKSALTAGTSRSLWRGASYDLPLRWWSLHA